MKPAARAARQYDALHSTLQRKSTFMIQYAAMALYRWSEIPREQLNPQCARQVIHGTGLTVARIYLAKGARVPEHGHANEQLSTIESGRLRMVAGGVEQILEAGDSFLLAPDLPHWVEALEETVALDIFSPAREDWKSGDDAYLRR
jgi:quercetin dioxygenase-like cupin family protein